ncbi:MULTISPECIES: TraR/DksA family transcriptional regulator [Streptomyces]|jgi:DnaK suppressor protein|uniref:TraR/DksA C4-type zinc finger protein n=1 Tax=Streptomyces thermogriseus TaxID=75292 RepID=A0ABP4DND0_9ACTN|nr:MULTISPECIES: TraR/DksA C4-type zinc finger protein [Streptomyces]MDN5384922.1 TraR/DksA C4-type zinc finger protein [Streptomyces sp. LB8]
MSLETTRSDSAAERMSAQEARQRLEHERDSRLEQLRAIEESANGGQEAADLLKAQKSTLQRALKDIEAAFARLDDGSYGNCESCSKPIPVERLEILPYARCCVPCQQRAG